MLAFLDIERGRAKVVADELQPRIAGVANDRKDGIECGLQTFVAAVFDADSLLKKGAVRVELGRQQVRYRQYAVALGEALADAFFFREGVSHDISVGWSAAKNSESASAGPPFGQVRTTALSVIGQSANQIVPHSFLVLHTG